MFFSHVSFAFQVATLAFLVAAANAGFLSAPVAYSAPAIAPVAYSAPAVVKAAVPVATSYQNTYKVHVNAQNVLFPQKSLPVMQHVPNKNA